MEGRRLARRRSTSSPTGCATSSRSTAPTRSARSCRRTPRSRRWRSPRRSMRGLGSDNIDFRLRQTDFRGDGARDGIPWLGMPVADVGALDRALVVGSFLRKDQPLLAQRLRQAAKKGAQISIAAFRRRRLADAGRASRRSSRHRSWPAMLAQIVVAAAQGAGKDVPAALAGRRAAAAARGDRREPAVGRAAGDPARQLREPASRRVAARRAGAGARRRSPARRSACLHRSREHRRRLHRRRRSAERAALNAQAMLGTSPRKAYVLLARRAGVRLRQSGGRARRARTGRARRRADRRSARRRAYADVLLPIAPFTETAGTSSTAKAALQTLQRRRAAVGEARPAGKCCACWARCSDCRASTSTTSEQTCATPCSAVGHARRQARRTRTQRRDRDAARRPRRRRAGRRHADLLRRSAGAPVAVAASRRPMRSRRRRACIATLLDATRLTEGAQVKVRQGRGEAVLDGAWSMPRVPPGVVRIAAAHPSTCGLEGLSGPDHRRASLTRWTDLLAPGSGRARAGVARRCGRSSRSS